MRLSIPWEPRGREEWMTSTLHYFVCWIVIENAKIGASADGCQTIADGKIHTGHFNL